MLGPKREVTHASGTSSNCPNMFVRTDKILMIETPPWPSTGTGEQLDKVVIHLRIEDVDIWIEMLRRAKREMLRLQREQANVDTGGAEI